VEADERVAKTEQRLEARAELLAERAHDRRVRREALGDHELPDARRPAEQARRKREQGLGGEDAVSDQELSEPRRSHAGLDVVDEPPLEVDPMGSPSGTARALDELQHSVGASSVQATEQVSQRRCGEPAGKVHELGR